MRLLFYPGMGDVTFYVAVVLAMCGYRWFYFEATAQSFSFDWLSLAPADYGFLG
jgi:hypothetical protein